MCHYDLSGHSALDTELFLPELLKTRDREKYGVKKVGLDNAGPAGVEKAGPPFMERETDKCKYIVYR